MLLDAFILGRKPEIKGEGFMKFRHDRKIYHLTLSSIVRVKWNFDC